MDILSKIKKANLIGRGGACYPVADKWQMVKEAKGDEKYVVCNASEGEPGVKKDGYIIEHFAERVIDGMAIAIEFLGAKQGIFYVNHHYFKRHKKLLATEVAKSGTAIEIFSKPVEAGYIGGEETTALNVIEGKRAEPRHRPPFPPTSGLWSRPTLVNNVETFYDVSLVAAGEYQGERFYTLSGDCLYEGVFKLPADFSIEKILKATHNLPKFPFFVQVGGDGSGEVLNQKQLKKPVGGAGSIRVWSLEKYQPARLLLNWITFFQGESCGQCTPCREGTYRLKEILSQEKVDWNTVAELLDNLPDTAFCALGCAVPTPIRSYINNVLKVQPAGAVKLPEETLRAIRESIK